MKGEKVRSKSEVNIANMLHEKGIPYRYEEELQLRNGKIVSPDFTIFVKNGESVYNQPYHLRAGVRFGYRQNFNIWGFYDKIVIVK